MSSEYLRIRTPYRYPDTPPSNTWDFWPDWPKPWVFRGFSSAARRIDFWPDWPKRLVFSGFPQCGQKSSGLAGLARPLVF